MARPGHVTVAVAGCCVVVVSGAGDVWLSAAVCLSWPVTQHQSRKLIYSALGGGGGGSGQGGAGAGLSHLRSPGLSFLNRLPLKLIQWAARVTWNIVISAVVVVVVVVVASHNQ